MFQFDDGSSASLVKLVGDKWDRVVNSYSTNAGTTALGGTLNDTLTVQGDGSLVNGGKGEDTVTLGGTGQTVQYSRGDGVDTLGGIGQKATVKLSGDFRTTDLHLEVDSQGQMSVRLGAGDEDRIKLAIAQSDIKGSTLIDSFVLDDGSTLTFADLVARGVTVQDSPGQPAGDTVVGTDLNDVLHSVSGNMTLQGGLGNDTYVIHTGSTNQIEDFKGASLVRLADVSDWANVAVSRPDPLTGDVLLTLGSGNSVLLRAGLLHADKFSVALSGGEIRSVSELVAGLVLGPVKGDSNDNVIQGNNGGVAIGGGAGNDQIIGGTGADVLLGDAGNDVLGGGAGDDILFGGADDDEFVVQANTGRDEVFDNEGKNTLRFGVGIVPGQLLVERVGESSDVRINIDANNSVLVRRALDGAISTAIFADGTQWTYGDLINKFGSPNGKVIAGDDLDNALDGTSGNDILLGNRGDDVLRGNGGDDEIRGGDGKDRLFGGAGNDALDGNAGVDTYHFALGDGVDRLMDSVETSVLSFGAGLDLQSLSATRSTVNGINYMRMAYSPTDAILIKEGMVLDGNAFVFANGTSFTLGQVYGSALDDGPVTPAYTAGSDLIYGHAGNDALQGGAGNDRFYGGKGNDVLDGGANDDILEGGDGDDTYLMTANGGRDTVVEDLGQNSTIIIGPDAVERSGGPTPLGFTRSGNGLLLTNTDLNSSFYISNFYGGSGTWTLKNAQGATQDLRALAATSQQGRSFDQRREQFYANLTGSGDLGNGQSFTQSGTSSFTDARGNKFDYSFTRTRELLESDAAEIRATNAGSTVVTNSSFLRTIQVTYNEIVTTNNYTTTTTSTPGRQIPLPRSVVNSLNDVQQGTLTGILFPPGQGYTVSIRSNGDVYLEEPPVTTTTTTAHPTYQTVTHTKDVDLTHTTVTATMVVADVRAGENGNTVVLNANSSNLVSGGAGNDTVLSQVVQLGSFAYANVTGNWIDGGAGNDVVRSGGGDDEISGGVGTDSLDGEFGADTYVVSADDDGWDTIYDTGYDVIDVSLSYSIGDAEENVNLNMAPLSAVANLASGPVNWNFGRLGKVEGVSVQIVATASNLNALLAIARDRQPKPGQWGQSPAFSAPGLENLVTRSSGKLCVIGASPDIDLNTDYVFSEAGLAGLVQDTVRFEAGIDRSKLALAWGTTETISGTVEVLMISWGEPGGVKIPVGDTMSSIGNGQGIEKFEFSDGTVMSLEQMLALAPPRGTGVPSSIVVNRPIGAQQVLQDQTLNFSVPADAFTVTGNKTKRYSAIRIGGQDGDTSLPAWMSFDSNTGTFSGKPLNGDSGEVTVEVKAWLSDTLSATQTFTLSVLNVNDAPQSAGAIDPIQATSGQPVSWALPVDSFTDMDIGDRLSYRVDLSNGAALPSWISINYTTGRLEGTPARADVGTLNLRITATDLAGATASQTLALNILPAPKNAVAGTDGNDTLTGTADADALQGLGGNDQLNGGAGDDDYLFNPGFGQDTIVDNDATAGNSDTIRFGQGISPDSIVVNRIGQDLILSRGIDTITVKDWFVSSAQQVERVVFDDETVWTSAQLRTMSNTAPVLATPIANLSALVDAPVLFQIPANSFTDPDLGDTLAYTATLADGSALPAWLRFNAATQTFSGTPTQANIGNLDVQVTATDGDGATVSANFAVGVSTAADQTLAGTAGTDTLTGGSGNDTLDGGLGADTLIGKSGNDTYRVDNAGDTIVENANEGSDTVQSSISWNLGANLEDLTLTGTAAIDATGNDLDNNLVGNSGNNVLMGGLGNDTLMGGAGNDTLAGGAGDDAMSGGIGDDLYTVDSTKDVVTEASKAGTDTVQSSVSWTLGANVENLTLTGLDAINATGNSLVNVLIGNAANNTLNGGAGADTLRGGAGNDTYTVDNAGDVVAENADEGTDLVKSSITYTLGANLENLTLTGSAAINGTGNDANNTLTGNTAANTLTGGGGNDTLNGAAGADTLVGGQGDDIYIVDNAADVVTEQAAEGTDLVQTAISYTLGANTENLTLTGSAAVNATGNELANTLVGNAAINTLTGGAGNDTLNGGRGADILIGGTGDDVYIVDNALDAITENAAEGTDTVQSSISYTLAAQLENLVLTGTSAINATGNALTNLLTGNSGNNTLDGGAGADVLIGGIGNDTYIVDNAADTVTEQTAEGTDTVKASVDHTLSANVENLTLTGTDNLNATGNALNNKLTGNAGNNVLNGMGGTDTLLGGAGDDIYIVDNSTTVVTEAANAGADTVKASVNYTLTNNVENLILVGNTKVNGTGNTLANTLTGNEADNVLNGAAGADAMTGGKGNDTYVVDNAADTTIEAATEGTDTVQSSINWTLGDNIENLTLTGTAARNGTGNQLNNVLTGNSGANTLTGMDGNDTLDGGAGADKLIGGAGNDTYKLGRGYGADTITENDATVGNTDVALFDAGITTDQLWFQKVGNNLQVDIIGTTDKFTLSNWYLGNQYHVEQFKTSDGKVLLDSQVQALVQAMAAFSPPAAGQTTLAANYATALNPVLAASWN